MIEQPREQAEEELRESREQLSLALEGARMGLFNWNVRTGQSIWSEYHYRILGYEPGEVAPGYEAWRARVHPEDLPGVEAMLDRALRDKASCQTEYRVVRPDGNIRWVQAMGRYYFDQKAQAERMLGVMMDITERKQAEEALRRSEQEALRRSEALYRAMARNIPDGAIGIVDHQLRYVIAEGSLITRLGLTREGLEGKRVSEVFEGERGFNREKYFRQALEGRISSYETVYRGRVIWSQMAPLRDENGRVIGALSLALDVTERKQAEEAVRESERFVRATLDSLSAHIAIADENGTILGTNKAWREFARANGTQPERVSEGSNYLAPLEQAGGSDEQLARSFAAGIRKVLDGALDQFSLEYPCHSPTEKRWFVGRVTRFAGKGPKRLVLAHEDITERKRAEEALLGQNRRLALLNEATAQLLSASDPDQIMAGIYERIAGYFQTAGFFEFELNEQKDELVRKSCVSVGEPGCECKITRFRMGEGIVGTVARQRAPIVVGQIQDSDQPNVRLLRELGVRAYACYPLVVRGHLLGTLSFASRHRDAFELEDQEFFETLASYAAMAKERKRLANQLRTHAKNLETTVAERTAKLREMVAELEHMSYSIIHDLRAPLRAIQGYACLITRDKNQQLSPVNRDLLTRMITAANRMDNLITDALNYNRAVREELPLRPVDVAGLLRGMLESYPEFQPPKADIRLEGEFPRVLANEAGLTQCFSNLLGNAVKFVRPGRKPQIRIWAETVDGPQSSVLSPQSRAPSIQHPVSSIRIWFEDNGTGIPKAGQGKIFDMFQRMHGKQYEGTGIGLALVRKVTERMGGKVGVESEEGKGSRFWLELPVAGP